MTTLALALSNIRKRRIAAEVAKVATRPGRDLFPYESAADLSDHAAELNRIRRIDELRDMIARRRVA